MKYYVRSIAAFLLFSPLLVQCVPTGADITNLDLRVRNLDNRVVKMHQDVADVVEKTSRNHEIEAVQQKQAEMSSSLDRLNMEFLQIKGQLEESSHFYQSSKETTKQLDNSYNKRVNDLAEQIMLLADQMNKTASDIDVVKKSSEDAQLQIQAAEIRAKEIEAKAAAAISEAEKKAAEAIAQAEEARKESEKITKIPVIEPEQVKSRYKDGKKIEPVTTEVAKVEPQETTPELETAANGPGKEIYDQALVLFRAGKYNQAYRVFTDYIEQNPTGKMAPNARFWLGDCYYNQQEYELAILEYQKVIADFTKHPKAPAALLKQGLAFEKLKDKATAAIVYRKLMEEYPKSEQFTAAKKRIESF